MDHIRDINYYKVKFFSKDYDDGDDKGDAVGFLHFPERKGWHVSEDGECTGPSPGQRGHDAAFQLEHFLQAWLFFGLIKAVLGYSNSINFDKFIGPGIKEPQVTSTHLPGLLKEWARFESNPDNRIDQSARMIRIQMALDCARKVVKRYCSVEEEDGQVSLQQTDPINDGLALSLIVLGETLSYAKSRIVERAGFPIRGWHGEHNAGWGTSKAVVTRMRTTWCPKTTAILKRQLRGNTTALLEAFDLYRDTNPLVHHRCTDEECKLTSASGKNTYKRNHDRETCNCILEPGIDSYQAPGPIPSPNLQESCKDGCLEAGPDKKRLLEIIKEDGIPVFELEEKTQNNILSVQVTRATDVSEYATISHVWSDGFGNPDQNQLCQCQLKLLKNSLKDAQETRGQSKARIAFWMDTLAIPVGKDAESREMKSKCIRRIHEIFIQSKYTLVFDGGLIHTETVGSDYSAIAVQILACGWMRRLWTLQEAYLSERLLFAFKSGCLDLEDLESHYHDGAESLVSDMPTAARNYFHNLLGTARRARIHEMNHTEGVQLISSVWKAATWRTTTKSEHEVMALVSLLNLNTDDSDHAKIINRGFGVGEQSKDIATENMKEFWMLLEELYPGSIPAGMIFLPPPRLSEPGFKWAPRTWMSGKELEHPDPLLLSALTPPGRLSTQHGLLVHFPGFLLHSTEQTSQKILLNASKGPYLTFPTDNTLLEWYRYRKVQDDSQYEEYVVGGQPVTKQADSRKYAIILPRERPGSVEEIGLLVEIGKRQPQRSFSRAHETRVFHVSIKFRILIKREIVQDKDRSLKDFYSKMHAQQNDLPVFGEILDPSQKWYVGGNPSPLPPRQEKSSRQAEPESTTSSSSGWASRITRSLTDGPKSLSTSKTRKWGWK